MRDIEQGEEVLVWNDCEDNAREVMFDHYYNNLYYCKVDKSSINNILLGYKNIKSLIEYPIFKIADKGTDKKYIVKFTGKMQGEVIFAFPNAYYQKGTVKDNWAAHTNEVWKDVPYNKEKNLYHKQLVECWGNNTTHMRTIRFYDAINDCTFSGNGVPGGFGYQNYKAIPTDRYDAWVFEAYQTLKDK